MRCRQVVKETEDGDGEKEERNLEGRSFPQNRRSEEIQRIPATKLTSSQQPSTTGGYTAGIMKLQSLACPVYASCL